MKNKIIHDTIILTVITIVAGFLLGLVHDITKKPIADAEFKSSRQLTRRYLQTPLLLKNTKILTRMRQQRQQPTPDLKMTSLRRRR